MFARVTGMQPGQRKGKILDGFVAVTDYERKYAIRLLSTDKVTIPLKKRPSIQQYDEQVRQALMAIWYAANKICSKRLVPFSPQLITAMEKHGHLRLSEDVRATFTSHQSGDGRSYAESGTGENQARCQYYATGQFVKRQIQIRTFADWDDVTPGFVEADLVAHCGGNTSGHS